MSDYIYKNPLEKGFKQFKLTKKQHNELFKYRQIKWFDRYKYYYSENEILLHKFYNWKAIILSTVLFPITILVNGIFKFNECCVEMQKLYNQKKYGYFSGDTIWKGSEMFDKIMKLIK